MLISHINLNALMFAAKNVYALRATIIFVTELFKFLIGPHCFSLV